MNLKTDPHTCLIRYPENFFTCTMDHFLNSCFYYINDAVVVLISSNLHKKLTWFQLLKQDQHQSHFHSKAMQLST